MQRSKYKLHGIHAKDNFATCMQRWYGTLIQRWCNVVLSAGKEKKIHTNKHTVHRIMTPPRKNTRAGRRYKSLVNAHIPPKNNGGERHKHKDFHYTCAQVALINELGSYCSPWTVQLSCDNKNKVDVGTLAVYRRLKINTFYLESDAPVYESHDFPYRNSKLTPAGYQILNKKRRSRSVSPQKSKPLVTERRHMLSSSFQYKKKLWDR